MELVLFNVLYLYVFWAFYVLVMGIYRAYLSNRLVGLNKILSLPVVAAGIVLDALANIFIATVVFIQIPKEWLVTTRLTKYQAYTEEDLSKSKYLHKYRKWLAQYICDHLLDPFDPSGNHC